MVDHLPSRQRSELKMHESAVLANFDDMVKYAHGNVYDSTDEHSEKLALGLPPDNLNVTGEYLSWHETTIAH